MIGVAVIGERSNMQCTRLGMHHGIVATLDPVCLQLYSV